MSNLSEILKDRFDQKTRGKKQFLELVDFHQRAWGTETYKGRPNLQQIMDARVVAFWHPPSEDDMHLTITLHKNLDEIQEYLVALIWHTKVKLPSLRLAKVFVDQQPKKIKAVRIVFG